MERNGRAPGAGERLPGLRALRRQRGPSQAEPARRAGPAPVVVHRVESRWQRARRPAVEALAAALGGRPRQLRGAPPGAGGAADVAEGRR